jgi:HAD superfamily hydrolase (TIGR01484 family)
MYHRIPKAVIFDLDGTLAESKQILTSDMGELLQQLSNRTCIGVASGAGFEQYKKQLLAYLPASTNLKNFYLLPVNAAQIYKRENDAWVTLYDESFTREERDAIFTAFEDSLKEAGMHEEKEELFGARIEDRAAQVTFSALGQNAPIDRKQGWDPDASKRQILRKALEKRLSKFSIAIGGMTSVDVTRKGIDKAYGVSKLSAITGIRIADMLYVGDALFEGGNDAVVKKTGIPTHEVKNTGDTKVLIQELLSLVNT